MTTTPNERDRALIDLIIGIYNTARQSDISAVDHVASQQIVKDALSNYAAQIERDLLARLAAQSGVTGEDVSAKALEAYYSAMPTRSPTFARKAHAAIINEAIAAAVAKERAEVVRLSEALVQHNDRLRSAISVADRDGKDTNWLSFRGQLRYTAAEYHELVNECRKRVESGEHDNG